MSHKKDIKPRDEHSLLHGYCEWYWRNGRLLSKGVCFHGSWNGYVECYDKDDNIWEYYIGYYLESHKVGVDNKEGNCYIWNRLVV